MLITILAIITIVVFSIAMIGWIGLYIYSKKKGDYELVSERINICNLVMSICAVIFNILTILHHIYK